MSTTFFFHLSLIVYLFVSSPIQAQQYENLIFEGAGVRGLAYAGAVEQLDSLGILENIKRVGGTSSGAIAAIAVALHYSPQEMESLLLDLEISKFNDGKWFFIGGINRMIKNYGYYRGDKFSEWVGELIAAKTGDAEISFQEWVEKGYKKIYITGSSINNQRLIVFSHENYPQMKVQDAVRISMSIPFYFEPVAIDSMGNVLQEIYSKQSYDLMVDGGVIANFPIRIFDQKKYNSECSQIEENICINPATLAIRKDTEEQIEIDEKEKGLASKEIYDVKDFTVAFYVFILENLNRQSLIPEDWERTISVSSAGVDPRIKKLDKKDKEKLLKSGREGVRKFFKEKELSVKE